MVSTLAPPREERREQEMPPSWRDIEIDDLIFEDPKRAALPVTGKLELRSFLPLSL